MVVRFVEINSQIENYFDFFILMDRNVQHLLELGHTKGN